MQDPLAEPIPLGAAIAETLQELHPADLTFTVASTPGRRQSGDESGIVLAKAAGHGLERREI
jgi:hypothetical protein